MKHEFDPNAPPNAFVLVVMESNADWPEALDTYAPGCAVLKQEENETYADLVGRTKERVASIEQAGGFLRMAILACGERREAEVLAGRSAISRSLLQTMRGTASELQIIAPAGTPATSRQPFVALAGELTGELAG